MPAAKKDTKKTAAKGEVNEDHWTKRRSTEVDKTKRSAVEGSKIDAANIIATPRKRKNIDYKTVAQSGDVKTVKRATANTYEKRAAAKKIEKPKKTKKTTTKKTKKDEKKEEKKDEEKKEEEKKE